MTIPAPISPASPLILASGSRYRAELLSRIGVPFIAVPSDADETRAAGEAPLVLARRLAVAKAEAVAARHPGRWVLGSDQVAALGDRVLGKPGDRETAMAQLRAQSGQTVEFLTAFVVLYAGQASPSVDVDVTSVRFRALEDPEIERYVDAEPAFDCAGSFKSEGLGITLIEAIEARDPTGLIGLPLIALRRRLAELSCALP